jgi:hypothetical protein
MKKTLHSSVLVLFVFVFGISSCKKDAQEPNDEEVITTLKINFVPVGGGNTVSFQYDDPDGPGGNAPTKDDITLAPNKTYSVTLELLNKTTNPVEDITEEIEEEADAHRFYYEVASGSNITISGLDNDPNGVPLGLTSTWTTSGATTTGKVKITLRHYPATPPGKAANDLVTSTKSATDIEVEFNSKIQ